MNRLVPLACLAAILVLAATANGGAQRAAGTIQLSRISLVGPYGPIECPPATPADVACYSERAQGPAPGLGAATQTFTLFYTSPGSTNNDCGLWNSPDVTLTIAGKGTITATAANECQRTPSPNETMHFTVTGGSGLYAGATGSGTIEKHGVGDAGSGTYYWSGTITVPGLDFDTVPPIIGGVNSRTIRIAPRARRVRVSYSPTAQDAVDGPVPVVCKPRSGSFFELGPTRVSCSASDTSANTSRRAFTVTIALRR